MIIILEDSNQDETSLFKVALSFPPTSAVQGIQLVLYVCVSVCLLVSAHPTEPFDIRSQKRDFMTLFDITGGPSILRHFHLNPTLELSNYSKSENFMD